MTYRDEFDEYRGDVWYEEYRREGEAAKVVDDLRRKLAAIRDALAKIVISEGEDAGVILLSAEAPTHYDLQAKCLVYDHENFSPLGDALVSVARLASESVSVPTAERQPSPGGGRDQPNGWASVTAALRGAGLNDCQGVVRDCQAAGLQPEEAVAVIDVWRQRGCWGVGALHWRLTHAMPGDPADRGWPEPDPAKTERELVERRRQREATERQAYQIVKAGRKTGQTDEEIQAVLNRVGLTWPE